MEEKVVRNSLWFYCFISFGDLVYKYVLIMVKDMCLDLS